MSSSVADLAHTTFAELDGDLAARLNAVETSLIARFGRDATSFEELPARGQVELARALVSITEGMLTTEVWNRVPPMMKAAHRTRPGTALSLPGHDAVRDAMAALEAQSPSQRPELVAQWRAGIANEPPVPPDLIKSTYDDRRILPWIDRLIVVQLAGLDAFNEEARQGRAAAGMVAVHNNQIERRAKAAERYLQSVSHSTTAPVPELRFRLKCDAFTQRMPWNLNGAIALWSGATMMATEILAFHRWAHDRGMKPEQEREMVAKHVDRFREPANTKAHELARMGWPTEHLTWEALAGVVEDDPTHPSGFRWRGFHEKNGVVSHCSALLPDPDGEGRVMDWLVHLANQTAMQSVYPFSAGAELPARRQLSIVA